MNIGLHIYSKKTSIFTSFTIFVLIFLSCTKEADIPQREDSTSIITPSGGTLSIENVTLEIPPGAVDQETEIFIDLYSYCNTISSDDVHLYNCISTFRPIGLEFNRDITFILRNNYADYSIVDIDNLPVEFNIGGLGLYRIGINERSAERIESSSVYKDDNDNVYITSKIDRLGNYQIGIPEDSIHYWGGSYIAKLSGDVTLETDQSSRSRLYTHVTVTPAYMTNEKVIFIRLLSKLGMGLQIMVTSPPEEGKHDIIMDGKQNHALLIFSKNGEGYSLETIPGTEASIEFTEFGQSGEMVTGTFSGIATDTWDTVKTSNINMEIDFSIRALY